MLRIPYFDIL